MKLLRNIFTSIILLVAFTNYTLACSPCGALSNVTQNINGTNLELTFTSNAGWQCCYTVQIEIVCANANFTGVANYSSAEICINGGTGASSTWSTPEPYPLTVIDLSNFCPGTYKWRAAETACMIYTPEQQFTVAGASPIQLVSNLSQDTICQSQNTQLSVVASNGCNAGGYSYSWAPAAGLSNANIANPVATPSSTTTYTVTVTENGSCTAPQTSALTVTVNPMPTANVSGTVELCQGEPSPTITFTGANGTAPYTITYDINGSSQTIVASSSATLSAQTANSGLYTYTIVSVEDANQCSQNQNSTATVTVNALPVVNAGPDQVLCEPNGVTPSEVTLNGSGATTYTWDNSAQNGVPFTPPVGQTTYTVTGTDANGCTDTDQLIVTSLTLPVANGAPSDTYGNADLVVDFSNLSQYAINYVWDFGNGSTQNETSTTTVSYNYTIPGIYTITLTASNGICSDTWTTEIEVLPPMIVTPPNVFTPNSDNANDLYFVNVDWGEHFEAVILNRWGNVMKELSSIDQGWDGKIAGKDCDEGIYFIKYKATDFGGKEVEGHTYFHLER
ncbi:MAG: T9SS type B sorting domain-containing protein [Crocinitomicaceae bacterium]|nr:MAG: T9SS type B sorting domain-containing protein [Crocinitomicaceae bacterium]